MPMLLPLLLLLHDAILLNSPCGYLGVAHVQGVREIEEWMSHSSGLSLDDLRPHMFLLRDRDATGHLLK